MHQVDFAETSKKGKEEVEGMKSFFSSFTMYEMVPNKFLFLGKAGKVYDVNLRDLTKKISLHRLKSKS